MNVHQPPTARKYLPLTPEELELRDRLDAEACEAEARGDIALGQARRTALRELFARVGARADYRHEASRWGVATDRHGFVSDPMTPEQKVAYCERRVRQHFAVEAAHERWRASGGTVAPDPERDLLRREDQRLLAAARLELARARRARATKLKTKREAVATAPQRRRTGRAPRRPRAVSRLRSSLTRDGDPAPEPPGAASGRRSDAHFSGARP